MAERMVMLRSNKPVITYEVYDDHGRSVGCVILPRSPRVVGPAEGTVLLRRPAPKAMARVDMDANGRSRRAS
jgi:hypothetical protein